MTKISHKLEKEITERIKSYKSTITDCELSLLIYMIINQNQYGVVEHLTYKEVVDTTGMSKSSFYKSLYSLEDKNIVVIDEDASSNVDFNVVIIENTTLLSNNYKDGYTNLNYELLKSREFYQEDRYVKFFIIHMLRLNVKYRKNGVSLTRDTIKSLKVQDKFDELRKYFTIELNEYETLWVFNLIDGVLKNGGNANHISCKRKLVHLCRKYSIKYSNQELKDTVKSVVNQISANRFIRVCYALEQFKKWGRLQPKFLNYYCTL